MNLSIENYAFKDIESIQYGLVEVLKAQDVYDDWCDGKSFSLVESEEFSRQPENEYSGRDYNLEFGIWIAPTKCRLPAGRTNDIPMELFAQGALNENYCRIYIDDKAMQVLIDGNFIKPINKSNTTGTIMASVQNTASKTLDANKTAAKLGLQVGVGKAANKVAVDLVKGQLPMMVRGYAETPFGKLVLANIAQVAVHQFANSNPKAVIVADSMVQAAMLDIVGMVDVEGLIDGLMEKLPKGKIDELLKQSDSE